ncbi:MAG TPA: ATP synthase F1 subunit epsilon [Polyangiales bacterium]|nr:ATP synthase F1 subunit epsilon [Polyangiales bacterium]
MATLHLDVATPDGLALQTEAESVAAPSIAGEFGVLPGHLPLLAATKAGLLKYKVGGKDEVAAVGPGFVEALPDKVLLLTDAFLKPSQIDRAKAESELASAEKALAEYKGAIDSADGEELVRAVEWARARVDASKS